MNLQLLKLVVVVIVVVDGDDDDRHDADVAVSKCTDLGRRKHS